MPSRRELREAVVQLLYARSLTTQSHDSPEFWELVNDRSYRTFDQTRVRLLAHFSQGRFALAQKLRKILSDTTSHILAADPSESLARELIKTAENETHWAESTENLLLLARAKIGGWQRQLHQLLDQNRALKPKRDSLLPKLEPLPQNALQPLQKIFAKLDQYDERARMVHFPQNYPGQRELLPLHRLQTQMSALASEASTLAEQVINHLPQIDQTIQQHTQNFDLPRLSQVDLAILRLATFEILHLPDLNPAISINEAIDLARDFSGADSAAFVNGVLDPIAKTHAPQ